MVPKPPEELAQHLAEAREKFSHFNWRYSPNNKSTILCQDKVGNYYPYSNEFIYCSAKGLREVDWLPLLIIKVPLDQVSFSDSA